MLICCAPSAEGPGELGLRAGDVVTSVEQVDSEWYRGTCRGSTGFFPANYVKVLVRFGRFFLLQSIHHLFDDNKAWNLQMLTLVKDDLIIVSPISQIHRNPSLNGKRSRRRHQSGTVFT